MRVAAERADWLARAEVPVCRCPTCCGRPWRGRGRGPRRQFAVERERTRQVARIGSNLNQLARWANTYGEGAEAVEIIAHLVAIERAIAELARLRSEEAVEIIAHLVAIGRAIAELARLRIEEAGAR